MALYSAQTNSPSTTLSSALGSSATTAVVANASVLPSTTPYLLTFGFEQANSETVLVTAVNGNNLTITRGVDGVATDWGVDTPCARVFTAYDWNEMISAVDGKADKVSSATNGNLAGLDSNGNLTDSGKAASSIPTASTTTPSMDGTGSYGSGTSYARSNHVHPSDTSRQPKITASGILKGNGSGTVSAAAAGTDYQAPLTQGTNITISSNTISAAGLKSYTGTFTAATGDWTSSGGYYTQTLTISGLKATYSVPPMVDIDFSQTSRNDATADAAIVEAFALITVIETGANSLTAYCAGDAPTTAVPIVINVWE